MFSARQFFRVCWFRESSHRFDRLLNGGHAVENGLAQSRGTLGASLDVRRLGRSGAVAIITAIAAPILLMIVGFVADFAYASYINQRLARAADFATLGSVSQTAATEAGGYGDLLYMQQIGGLYWNANIAQLGVSGANFSLSVVSDGNGGAIATSTYNCRVPTFFAGILGFNNIPVSGTAKASAHPLVYVNYYILVDASQSMGIASTQADMNRLYNAMAATPDGGCVFGCHVQQNGKTQINENVARAASPPIQLRIDAAVQAVQAILSQAQSIAGVSKNIKFALYTIQEDPASPITLHPIAALSNDYVALTTAAGTINLGNNNGNGRGDTDYLNELAAFNTALTTAGILNNGSGASATSPLNYFFIITDGLADTYGPCHGFYYHCTSAIDPLNCLPLKSKGTVGILYTTYAPIWKNNNPAAGVLDQSYIDLVSQPGIDAQIRPNLQSCASSASTFFEAQYGPDIVTQMQALFQSTQAASARLSQ